jgi:hypothetical protein
MRRASGQLLALSQMGVPSDERTHRGCEFVLSKPWIPMRGQRDVPLCYTANCLRLFSHFGFGSEGGWMLDGRFSQSD